ncbi:hypothetical protein [Oricola cellulosilytica]|uniref:hypothetical protein n=1 Tax=Oricola cellulosilytica TaxID=1429082 RepID=UPI001304978A|nr:hypothetical protein [Oricola cellulosilytica]
MLIVGGLKNPDPVASREEQKGFNYMDRSSIGPIVEMVEQWGNGKAGNKSGDSISR